MNAHVNPYQNASRFNPDASHYQKANALIEALERDDLQKVVFSGRRWTVVRALMARLRSFR